MNAVNQQIRLAARPSGLPSPADWELTTEPVPEPRPGEFVVAVSYLSVDPAMLRWIAGAGLAQRPAFRHQVAWEERWAPAGDSGR